MLISSTVQYPLPRKNCRRSLKHVACQYSNANEEKLRLYTIVSLLRSHAPGPLKVLRYLFLSIEEIFTKVTPGELTPGELTPGQVLPLEN